MRNDSGRRKGGRLVAMALGTPLQRTAKVPVSAKGMERNGMAQDFSWEKQGKKYVEIYRRLVA